MSTHNLKIKRFSLHQFEDRASIKFDPNAYSRLKYGSGEVGKQFGEELAVAFYEKYYDVIAKQNERAVVDIETLRKVQDNLLQTIDEIKRIKTEGEQARKLAAKELESLEQNLKDKVQQIK